MAEPQLIAQVEDRASRVQKQIKSSKLALATKTLGGAAAAAAESALNGLEPLINNWADRGRTAAKTGAPPLSASQGRTPGKPITWEKWVTVGEGYLQGINEITREGLNANLDLIKESIASVPADTVKVVKKVATTAATVAKETAAVAADVSSSLLRPLLLPLGIVAAVAAFVYLKTRGGSGG